MMANDEPFVWNGKTSLPLSFECDSFAGHMATQTSHSGDPLFGSRAIPANRFSIQGACVAHVAQ